MPEAVLAMGQVDCGECALEFTAATFRPVPSRPPPAAGLEHAAGAASCARHARNVAIAACERCGSFMCALCRVEVEGRSLCAACFDRGRSEGSLHAAQTSFRSWRTLGLHLAVVGMFMYPFGILTGPASLYATARGVAQSHKDGDEGGLLGTLLAAAMGIAVTLGGIAFLFLMTEMFGRKAVR